MPTLDSRADPAIARTALRKVTLRLVPLIALGYGVAYMDRVNISFASLQMNRDLHFSNTVYGLGAGLFFLSYSACEVPSNLLLYRFGARRWLARIMVTWGAIAMAMVLVRTPAEFYVVRFFLGMAEAGFFPGVVFYLMQWFPPEMRARTIVRFYVSGPLSSVVMGAVAGALLKLQGRLSLAGWQWLFLVEALPAVLLGVVFYLVLPDSPAEARWLTGQERQAVLAGAARNSAAGAGESIRPALTDRRVWLLGAFMFCMLASIYAFSFSAPAILQSLTGLSIAKVGFVVAGMFLLGAAAMVWGGVLADRSGHSFRFIVPSCLLMVAGFLACGLSRAPAIAIPALTFVVIGNYVMQGPLWSLSATFLSGRSRAAGIAVMNTIGILGGFIGPYWMGYAKDLTGNDQRGLLTMTAPMLAAAAIMLYLRHQAKSPSGPSFTAAP